MEAARKDSTGATMLLDMKKVNITATAAASRPLRIRSTLREGPEDSKAQRISVRSGRFGVIDVGKLNQEGEKGSSATQQGSSAAQGSRRGRIPGSSQGGASGCDAGDPVGTWSRRGPGALGVGRWWLSGPR
jgi:hypothetical protein